MSIILSFRLIPPFFHCSPSGFIIVDNIFFSSKHPLGSPLLRFSGSLVYHCMASSHYSPRSFYYGCLEICPTILGILFTPAVLGIKAGSSLVAKINDISTFCQVIFNILARSELISVGCFLTWFMILPILDLRSDFLIALFALCHESQIPLELCFR